MRRILLALALMLALPGVALAQTCAGVEWRVNAQTAILGTGVGAQIQASQLALLTLEQLNRTRLLSAVRVMTEQQSSATDSGVLMETKAGEAAASTVLTERQNQELVAAQSRYRATGFRACNLVKTANSFYDSVNKAGQKRQQITAKVKWKPGEYGDPGDWTRDVRSGPFDASAIMEGDADKAGRYINFLMGPPDLQGPSGVSGDSTKISKAQRDALKSTSQYVLSSIASDYADGGPIAKLKEMNAHFLGKDGGEAWSARMAAAPERGVLMDAIRMEAANIATMAFALKSNARQEAAYAALLLAQIEAATSRAQQEGGAR